MLVAEESIWLEECPRQRPKNITKWDLEYLVWFDLMGERELLWT